MPPLGIRSCGASFALSSVGGIPAAQAMVSFAGAKQNAATRFFAVTLDSADVYPGLFTEGAYASYAGIYALDWGQASWTLKTAGIAAGDDPFFVAMARGNLTTAYVAGQQADDHARQADRFRAQLATDEAVARGGGIALVEDQIDNREDGA